jgi:glycogen(starch) synthase
MQPAFRLEHRERRLPVGTGTPTSSRQARSMKILISSHAFLPLVGGIETVTELLARAWAQAGHEIVLVTQTPCDDELSFPFAVYRRPSAGRLLRLLRWSDLYFHSNISLRTAWPLMPIRRPWVIAHHGELLPTVRGKLKRLLSRCAYNIAVSQAVACGLGIPCTVQPNPYDDRVFRRQPGIERRRDLIFVGRLVSVKGVASLLDALRQLQLETGLTPNLAIVGDGPERSRLQQQSVANGLQDRITFAGWQRGDDLARLLNESKILVVPSLSDEPFGVVALEGIACGCAVVGSRGGGLADAVGPCGLTFANGSTEQLAARLQEMLGDPSCPERFTRYAHRHLHGHRPARVAAAYLEAFTRALNGESPSPAPRPRQRA